MTTDALVPVIDHVVAADGTRVVVHRLGSGPPIVVLPAAMLLGESWLGVAQELAASHTVLLVDRRGYGTSDRGPAPNSFEREIADVRAVIEAVGEPVHLAGHSYGALLALRAALADPAGIATLLLYEPPLLAAGPHLAAVLDRYRARLAADDPMGAIGLFLDEVARVPEEAIAGEDAVPPHDELTALARSVLGDLEALSGLDPDARPFAAVTVPTLLLTGALSWDPLPRSAGVLQEVMPGAETVVWPGQSHFANMLDPALVADTIRDFLWRRLRSRRGVGRDVSRDVTGRR